MTKPLAPHGTYARYTGRPASNIPGCRCDLCTAEGRRYVKRRDYLTATGRPLTVDATPARQHLTALFTGGAGWNQLAAATTCSAYTIWSIHTGAQTRILRSTEQKILATRLDQALPANQRVPALGSIRRIHALTAIGHSGTNIANEAGVSNSLICSIRAEKLGRVFASTHTGIARAFTRLAMVPGRCSQARALARRNGWAPPLAWDDNLDDPDAAPVTVSNDSGLYVDEIAVLRLAQGDHSIHFTDPERPLAARQLAAHGLSPCQIAKALHTHGRKVEVWLAEAA